MNNEDKEWIIREIEIVELRIINLDSDLLDAREELESLQTKLEEVEKGSDK